MDFMIIIRLMLSLILSLFLSIVIIFLLNGIIGYLYGIYYDIPAHEDLSDDFGLGMILFFFDAPVFFISIFLWMIFFMRRFRK